MIRSFADAWKEIWRFALPLEQTEEVEPPRPLWIIRFLPLAGLALGLALWLGAVLVEALVPQQIAAAAVIAIGVPALYHWLTAGRSLKALSDICREIAVNRAAASDQLVGILAVQGILVLQIFATAVLALTANLWWLVLAPMLGATAYAELLNSEINSPDANDDTGPVHWYIAAGVAILISGLHGQLIAGLFVLLIAWLLGPALGRFLASRSTADSGLRARAAFHAVEILVLWVGVLAA